MKKLFRIVIVSSLTFFLFSCYYNELPEEVEIVIPPDTEVSFNNDILPIFALYNCTQCHKPASQSPDLTPSNAYNALVPAFVKAGNSSGSKLYTFLAVDGHRNVDTASLALIKKWIDDGAKSN